MTRSTVTRRGAVGRCRAARLGHAAAHTEITVCEGVLEAPVADAAVGADLLRGAGTRVGEEHSDVGAARPGHAIGVP
jgi:hypothetical protein